VGGNLDARLGCEPAGLASIKLFLPLTDRGSN